MTLQQIYETRPDGMEWVAYNEKHRIYLHPQEETYSFLYESHPMVFYEQDNYWKLNDAERNDNGWEWKEVKPEVNKVDMEMMTRDDSFFVDCWILCRNVQLEIFPDGRMDFRETHYTPKEKVQILELIKDHYRKEKEKAEQRVNDCVRFISFIPSPETPISSKEVEGA